MNVLCECNSFECMEPIEVPSTLEFAQLVTSLHSSGRYIVLPGHQSPDDIVETRNEKYWIVKAPPGSVR